MLTVMFTVAGADAGAVMAALAPVMPLVKGFTMESRDEMPARPKRHSAPRGSKVEDAIIKALTSAAERKATVGALGEALVKIGLNANSVSPGVSNLEKAGRVARRPGRVVELLK